MMNLGEGDEISMSNKRKLNVKISTEGELVQSDDALRQMIWGKIFNEGRGYNVEHNTMYHDDISTVLLKTMVGVKVEREPEISRNDIICLNTQSIGETLK